MIWAKWAKSLLVSIEIPYLHQNNNEIKKTHQEPINKVIQYQITREM